jgi:hypothetical protein
MPASEEADRQEGTYLAGAQARELGHQTAISTVERLTET